jgi:hypothetical protein
VRQIDLCLDLFFAPQSAGWLGGGCLRFAGGAEVGTYLLRFMLFQRTGMCLLLGHPDFRQHIEDGFAFDFQLSGEIVDSNLAHPAFLFPALCSSLHRDLTESMGLCGHRKSARAYLLFVFRSRAFLVFGLALRLTGKHVRLN